MRFNPRSIPFWERERGDGPETRYNKDQKQRKERGKAKRALNGDLEMYTLESQSYAEGGDGCGNRWVGSLPRSE